MFSIPIDCLHTKSFLIYFLCEMHSRWIKSNFIIEICWQFWLCIWCFFFFLYYALLWALFIVIVISFKLVEFCRIFELRFIEAWSMLCDFESSKLKIVVCRYEAYTIWSDTKQRIHCHLELHFLLSLLDNGLNRTIPTRERSI